MATLTPPKELSRAEKMLWRQITGTHPHLSEADIPLLTVYVRLLHQWQVATRRLAEDGVLAVSERTGREYLSPAAQGVAVLSHRTVRLARELGLTVPTRPKGSAPAAAGRDEAGKPSAVPKLRAI
jgi:P27 family predicted phage terminase small subunit